MPVYERSSATEIQLLNEWDGGVSWLAHPNEMGARASHAVTAADGVWVIDPLDGPGVDALLDDLGEVAGVAVLCSYHARDAGKIANRHDVAVYLPRWMDGVAQRVATNTHTHTRIERYDDTFGESGFTIRHIEPLSMWQEAIAYRETDGTLIVPDLLGTGPGYTVHAEQLGVVLSHRLFPPTELFDDMEPERILLGHGAGVFDDASTALDDALDGARRRFPRALVTQLGTNIRLFLAALKD